MDSSSSVADDGYPISKDELLDFNKPKEEEKKMKKAIAAVLGAWLLVTVLVSGTIAVIWAVVVSLQALFS